MSSQRRKYASIAGLASYGACLAAAITGALYHFSSDVQASDPTSFAAGSYRYAVILFPKSGGGCRRINFDNNSGIISENAAVSCPLYLPATNSTEGRMTAIREAFAKK